MSLHQVNSAIEWHVSDFRDGLLVGDPFRETMNSGHSSPETWAKPVARIEPLKKFKPFADNTTKVLTITETIYCVWKARTLCHGLGSAWNFFKRWDFGNKLVWTRASLKKRQLYVLLVLKKTNGSALAAKDCFLPPWWWAVLNIFQSNKLVLGCTAVGHNVIRISGSNWTFTAYKINLFNSTW